MTSHYAVKELMPKELKNKNTNKYLAKVKIPEHMMLPPFRNLYIAPSNSGKTLAFANLLTNDIFGYKKLFGKNIFIFSPTIGLDDPSLYGVQIPSENIFDDYYEDIIDSIVNEQNEIIKEFGKKNAPHILLILDDLITSIPDTKKDILKKLFFSARHYCISLIINSQSFTQVPRALRLNASNLFVFQVNDSEIKRIAEEQPIRAAVFREIYEQATEEPFSFLHINMKKHFKRRYWLRYEPIMFEF